MSWPEDAKEVNEAKMERVSRNAAVGKPSKPTYVVGKHQTISRYNLEISLSTLE